MAGGINSLVTAMDNANIKTRGTNYSSEIWAELSETVFSEDNKKNRHWLWVVWNKNRKGLKDLIQQEEPLRITQIQSDEENKKDASGEEKENLSTQTDFVEVPDEDKESENKKGQEIANSLADISDEDLESKATDVSKVAVSINRRNISKNGKTLLLCMVQNSSDRLGQTFCKLVSKKNPCCTLAFKNQHVKGPYSRKKNSPYLNITAVCTLYSCCL
ncbi:uncharacterized protein V6R79_008529 [Siganus canaliculatus]